MHQVAPGIYFEDAYPGVTLGALIFPHGTFLVDAPLRAEDARTWRSVISNLAMSPNRILVNLDAHLERTIGARADSTIISHLKTAQVFRNRPSVFKGQTTESGAEWEVSNDVLGTRWAIPDLTFSNSRDSAGAANPFVAVVDPARAARCAEDYLARVFAAFCTAAGRLDPKRGRLVAYEHLPAAVWDVVAPHFGLVVDPPALKRMGDAARVDAKSPVDKPAAFTPDDASKRSAASPELRRAVDSVARPAFERLLALVPAAGGA